MRIVVAMSGGVDSSVAAALLARDGHDVIGLSMQLYDHSGGDDDGQVRFGSCCTINDLYDARRVAASLGIPHYIVNFEQQFGETVVSNFIREYSSGRTPIPCVHCNGELKFATLASRAGAFGAELVATGHYARVERNADGRFLLKRGVDASKDQSYFLFTLTQEQLSHAIFPVGGLDKREVRDLARELGLAVSDKPDSHEICFVSDGDHAAFMASHGVVPGPGQIRDVAGRVIGAHEGIHRYTVGQRKGLGLSSPVRLYVVGIDAEEGAVTVGPREALERSDVTASGVSWVSGVEPVGGMRATAQIRYRHREGSVTITPLPDRRVRALFDEPQYAVAPGQAVVFYDGDVVLGGGWIE